MSADADVLAAVKTQWETKGLATKFPGGIHEGDVPAGAGDAGPYVKVKVGKGPTPNQDFAPVEAGRPYIDYRRLTFTVWAVGTEASGPLIDAIQGAFRWKEFTVPNSTFLSCRPLDDGTVDDRKGQKAGEDVRAFRIEYEVCTQRTHA